MLSGLLFNWSDESHVQSLSHSCWLQSNPYLCKSGIFVILHSINSVCMNKIDDILIRKGQIEDIPALVDLIVQLAVYEKHPDAVTANVQDYQEAFNQKLFDFLVAVLDKKIVGICLYYDAWSTWKGRMLHLEDFIVDEAHRRLGVGDQLFDAFLEEARGRDCRLVKWQVLDWNAPAQRFYEKRKATIQKDWWNGLLYFE